MIHSFAPLAEADARCLILGSMPGQASLRAGQYYAHPRNQFWPIISALLNGNPAENYPQRCERLIQHQIGLWDVLKACRRTTSLDADIETNSMICNDFEQFFNQHRMIKTVCFNGVTAANCFKRLVLPSLNLELELIQLPSTSPAHATMSLAAKQQVWQILLNYAGKPAESSAY